jgi:hypothetical protein
MSARYRLTPPSGPLPQGEGEKTAPPAPYSCRSFGRKPTALSVRLRALCGAREGVVTLGELADAAGKGATALLLFVFGVASLIPGVAPVFGAAICVLSLSLLHPAEAITLPGALRRRSVPRGRLARLLGRWLPRLEWLEARLKPRLHWMLRGVGMGAVALACFASGVLIVLPIPFGNIPPAVTVLCLSAAVAAADGLLALGGLAAFLLALGFDAAVVIVFWDAIAAVIAAAF